MPIVAAGDICEVVFRGQIYGQRTLSVFHYQIFTVIPATDYNSEMAALLNTIDASDMPTKYAACAGTDFLLDRITAQIVSPIRRVRKDKAVTYPGTGGTSTGATNLASVITKETDIVTKRTAPFAMKGGVGSVHIPDPPADRFLSGVFEPAQLTAMDDFAVQMVGTKVGGVGNNWVPVLWHRNVQPQPSADIVQTYVVQGTVRVERRRTVGLGI